MAILDAYEVTILTPSDDTGDGSKTAGKQSWKPVDEYVGAKGKGSSTTDSCTRHIAAYTTVDQLFGHSVPQQFAIDFKVTGGFQFADAGDTEMLVFRVYHDDSRIGSGHIKREKWERPGSFRVRKRGRRIWLETEQWWVMENWSFDEGLHGTIKVEVWRERYGLAKSKARQPNLPIGMDDLDPAFYLSSNALDFNPSRTRVRYTEKIDDKPLATFLFEYRSQDTLDSLGFLKKVKHKADADVGKLHVCDDRGSRLPATLDQSNFGLAPKSFIEARNDGLPYKCDLCELRFKEQYEVHEHRKDVHRVKRWNRLLERQYWWTGDAVCTNGSQHVYNEPLQNDNIQPTSYASNNEQPVAQPNVITIIDGDDDSPTTTSSSMMPKTPPLFPDVFTEEPLDDDIIFRPDKVKPEVKTERYGPATTGSATKQRTYSSFDGFYQQLGLQVGVYDNETNMIDLTMDDTD